MSIEQKFVKISSSPVTLFALAGATTGYIFQGSLGAFIAGTIMAVLSFAYYFSVTCSQN